MRQLTNKHILQRDLSNPNPVIDELTGVYQDTVNYDRLYVAEEQSWFDRNLRENLGKQIDNRDYINIDELSPEEFDIRMFSPDELLNSGSSLVYYFGYDIHGNKLSSNPTLKDFFEKNVKPDDYVLIISARFSEFKGIAEKCLDTNGIRYDKIIYDTPRGERILINDRKPWGGGLDTAYSINIDRDAGL